jgi:hypothetical protein
MAARRSEANDQVAPIVALDSPARVPALAAFCISAASIRDKVVRPKIFGARESSQVEPRPLMTGMLMNATGNELPEAGLYAFYAPFRTADDSLRRKP